MIPLEQARDIVNSLEAGRIQNLFGQTHAKHVFYEVNESPDNFPDFDDQLEDKITFTAYSLLAAGCSMLEQQSFEEGRSVLEEAAALLQNAHGPFVAESRASSFHVLLAAMAFYACGQYSRAFVYIQPIQTHTAEAGLIVAFIRKQIDTLIGRISGVLLQDPPQFEDQTDFDEWAISVAIARSLSFVLEYLFTGNENLLNEADVVLDNASVIATTSLSPAHWWIVRLLKLMLGDLADASLWNSLPPLWDPGSTEDLNNYIRLLAFSTSPIVELWKSQLEALPLALEQRNQGGIINLRTSAGKTQVAELAILQTLSSDPDARVIYLAPFRSLAFEIERVLSASLSWLGFHVSHLYGGSRISSVDTELMSESSIIIATPEKTRAIFRAFPELFENVKLVIIDEGHLIGSSERFVKNELFIEHLRAMVHRTEARMLLLSAVLPNVQEVAEWLTGNSDDFRISQWKPSAERFGLLRWNGSKVRIDWHGRVKSFNPSFVEAKPVSERKNSRKFPKTKTEAVAATAVRLSKLGPVMIFAGQAQWVDSMARATITAMGANSSKHAWPTREWKVFEAVCQEELESESVVLEAARLGILCHSNGLTSQVRLAMEVLMRSYPPKIIVATTTLAQGVNVGISSVIIASPYIGKNQTIDKSDFWNICGRAGRAFVDGEGKILYAIDDTRSDQKVKKDERLAELYFDASSQDRVESGLLYVINILRQLAARANVSFDLLLGLVANNDFSDLGSMREDYEYVFDLIDDELLALHENPLVNDSLLDSVEWVDQVFRGSLAAIQAREDRIGSSVDDVISFLQARTTSTLIRVPTKAARKALVSSGLPLSVAIKLHEDLELFRTLTDKYINSERSLPKLSALVQTIESWARANASSITGDMPEEAVLGRIRNEWLGGRPLRVIIEIESDSADICKDFYGYELPWIIHAVSRAFDQEIEEERCAALSQIALLVELGVPSELAAKIFLAGIRSRTAATELAGLAGYFGSTISSIRETLRDPIVAEILTQLVSKSTGQWIQLVLADRAYQKIPVPIVPGFRLEQPVEEDTLYARTVDGRVVLCSLGGKKIASVSPSDQVTFARIADDPRFAFVQKNSVWNLVSRDPKH